MRVLGIETSCDETGVAVYDTGRGLLAHALHTQVAMHADYGGVVPELASRDHVRRVLPLVRQVLAEAGLGLGDLDGIAYTQGPGLAGALLVGASVANALGYALGKPVVGVHHLEGHLLSPLLGEPRPAFPFVALLVSGGHTQLYDVIGVGDYRLLGDTQDDAAGEAFDKTAKLLGLAYPGGPALARLAASGRAGAVTLPRPMLDVGRSRLQLLGAQDRGADARAPHRGRGAAHRSARGPTSRASSRRRSSTCSRRSRWQRSTRRGRRRLVVAGGVGANLELRARLAADVARRGGEVFYPDLVFCTDNGAMIALAGALRLAHAQRSDYAFTVKPRWSLAEAASARSA